MLTNKIRTGLPVTWSLRPHHPMYIREFIAKPGNRYDLVLEDIDGRWIASGVPAEDCHDAPWAASRNQPTEESWG